VYRELVALPPVHAEVVRGALEAEGFRVRLERDSLGVVYGLQTGRFATRVLVPEEDLPKARALLDEINASEA
jgi:hypothetical protein